MRKSLVIAIVIIVVAALGVGIYFSLRRGGPLAPSVEEERQTAVDQIIPKPQQLSDRPVFDYWVNKKSGEVHFLDNDGQIYKISASQEIQNTGSRATGNLSYIKPSQDGSAIIVAFGYPASITFAVYNAESKTWQALPAGTVAAAWDPKSNNRIAYLKKNAASSQLSLLTLSDGKSREVLRLAQEGLDLDWALPDIIYLRERQSAQTTSSIWAYDLKSQTIRTLIGDQFGLAAKWSPDGAFGLRWDGSFNIVDSKNRTLSLVRLISLPSKCAFRELLAIYCAAPADQTSIPVGSLPDEYLKKAVNFNDDIYTISLAAINNLTEIYPIKIMDSELLEVAVDADHLEINDNQLLFVNRYDKKLYSLEL